GLRPEGAKSAGVRGRGREKRDADDHEDGGHLNGGEDDLHGAAEAHAEVVDPGHDDDPDDSERLRPSEGEIVWLDPASEAGNRDVNGEERRGDAGKEKAMKAHHAGGNGRERARPADNRVHPSEEEAPGGAKAAAQVSVLATGFRNHRAAFGEGERAEKTMETARPSLAISAGFRKIPVPTMVPTTIAREAHAPRPRTSSRGFPVSPCIREPLWRYRSLAGAKAWPWRCD